MLMGESESEERSNRRSFTGIANCSESLIDIVY